MSAEPGGYEFFDANDLEWKPSTVGPGIEVKDIGEAGGMEMQLIRFAPDTGFPDHEHLDPEFVYMLEGSARQAGQWMYAGWSSAAAPQSPDVDFVSGPDGCVMLSVYGASRPLD